MKMHIKVWNVLMIVVLLAGAVFITPARPVQAAAQSLSAIYTQNFDSLLNTGTGNTFTDDSTLPGWYSSRVTYIAGTGSSNTGGL